ncbi:MAG: hypothetical protein IKI10_06325 [Muribaculaceae bacterium]|nr:hypothetical protein [Muribaculaceae bacterium]
MKQMIFMAVVLLMLVASCDRQPNKNNFPPDNAMWRWTQPTCPSCGLRWME